MTGALLLALAALAGPPSAAAQTGHGPVRVDAEQVQYAFQRHEVTFSGKRPVILTRDDATLTCRRIVAHTSAKGEVTNATCTGDVHFERGARVVTCEQANFDDAAERVICEGNVILKDSGSEGRGTKLVYNLSTDEANLEGTTGKQVIITMPSSKFEERQKALEERKKKERQQ